jgi:hypothetical protein
VCFSPNDTRLASGSMDHTLKVWDANGGQEILSLRGHTSQVYSVAFNPDGTFLASGSGDGTVKVWDGQSEQAVIRLRGHPADVIHVSFSADGSRVVSRDAEGNTLVWNRHGLLLTESPPADLKDGPLSPDGNWKVAIAKQTVLLVSTKRRDFWMEMHDRHQIMAPTWHAEDDWFAVAFHLGRLQQLKPEDKAVPVRLQQALQKLKDASIPAPRLPLSAVAKEK